MDRFLESRETGTFDASSVLEQALSSAAGSLDPKELERAKKELATSMRGFGASDQQIQESTQTVSAISQVQQLGEAHLKKQYKESVLRAVKKILVWFLLD